MIEFLPNIIPISVGAGCGFCMLGGVWLWFKYRPKKVKDEPKWEINNFIDWENNQ